MKITRREFVGLSAGSAAVAAAGIAFSSFPSVALAANKVFKMKMGNPFPTTHPGGSRMVEVCELIRKETQGVVDIAAFPNNQL